MRKLRILVLMHEDLVPPDSLEGLPEAQVDYYKTEFDVTQALEAIGHDVRALGVRDELRPIRDSVETWKPHVVWNLLEEFHGETVYDHNVVSYLELLRVPYTGCNPRGLVISRDKALSKKLAAYHRIRAPRFVVYRRGRAFRSPRGLSYPLIVKGLLEEASVGISRASLVRTDEQLRERVRFVHERIRTDAIVEQFVSGREVYAGVLGNERLMVFPTQELRAKKAPPGGELIATERVKHDVAYQKRHGIETGLADIPDALAREIARTSRRVYRMLHLDGYARIDYRLDLEGRLYFLEANPNAEIARFEEFANGAEAAGLSYEALLQRVLNLGLRRQGMRG